MLAELWTLSSPTQFIILCKDQRGSDLMLLFGHRLDIANTIPRSAVLAELWTLSSPTQFISVCTLSMLTLSMHVFKVSGGFVFVSVL